MAGLCFRGEEDRQAQRFPERHVAIVYGGRKAILRPNVPVVHE